MAAAKRSYPVFPANQHVGMGTGVGGGHRLHCLGAIHSSSTHTQTNIHLSLTSRTLLARMYVHVHAAKLANCRSGCKSCSDKGRILPWMHTPQFTLLPPPLFYELLTQGMSIATCAVSWTDTHTHTQHTYIQEFHYFLQFLCSTTVRQSYAGALHSGNMDSEISTYLLVSGLTTTKTILPHMHWITKARLAWECHPDLNFDLRPTCTCAIFQKWKLQRVMKFL